MKITHSPGRRPKIMDRDGIPDAAENDWGWSNRVADMLRDFAEGVL